MNHKENYNKIEAYLFGKMSDTEKAIFETELLTDTVLARAFEEQKLEHEAIEILIQKDLIKDFKQWDSEIDPQEISDTASTKIPETLINPNLFNWNTFIPIVGLLSLCLALTLLFFHNTKETHLTQNQPAISKTTDKAPKKNTKASATEKPNNPPTNQQTINTVPKEKKNTTTETEAATHLFLENKKINDEAPLEYETQPEAQTIEATEITNNNFTKIETQATSTKKTDRASSKNKTNVTKAIPTLSTLPPSTIDPTTQAKAYNIPNTPVTKIPNPCTLNSFLNIIEPEMIFIKKNRFLMGSSDKDAQSPDEAPQHQVIISAFSIGKYEVTNEEFVVFLNAEGNQKEGGKPWVALNVKKVGITKEGNCFKVKPGYQKHPVTFVSWFGAQAYARWLSKMTNKDYRLPTEAEWEYAASGGSKNKNYKYAGSNNPEKVAWYEKNAGSSFHEVGTREANILGLHDMSGNVFEWCKDWYDVNYYTKCFERGNIRNPEGPEKGSNKILRGGSWISSTNYLRCTHRHNYSPGFRRNRVGFRLAQSAE